MGVGVVDAVRVVETVALGAMVGGGLGLGAVARTVAVAVAAPGAPSSSLPHAETSTASDNRTAIPHPCRRGQRSIGAGIERPYRPGTPVATLRTGG
jgi:hypothetical protein